MEYNLRHLRGEGNGIYFTTYAADFKRDRLRPTYSNGIVNALRDRTTEILHRDSFDQHK